MRSPLQRNHLVGTYEAAMYRAALKGEEIEFINRYDSAMVSRKKWKVVDFNWIQRVSHELNHRNDPPHTASTFFGIGRWVYYANCLLTEEHKNSEFEQRFRLYASARLWFHKTSKWKRERIEQELLKHGSK